MMTYFTRRPFALILLALLFSAWTADAQQRAQSGKRVAAWVVLGSASTLSGEPSVVTRGLGPNRDDVLILHADANESQFTDAVRTLMASRSADGDTATRTSTFRLSKTHAGATFGAPFPWAARVLSDLRGAPMRSFPGIGRVRAVRIWLPAAGRGRTAR
jgi:hypothetical protein